MSEVKFKLAAIDGRSISVSVRFSIFSGLSSPVLLGISVSGLVSVTIAVYISLSA